MLNGVTKANEIIDSFSSNLESSSLRTSTTEISDILTVPDIQVNETPVDVPVDVPIELDEPFTELGVFNKWFVTSRESHKLV